MAAEGPGERLNLEGQGAAGHGIQHPQPVCGHCCPSHPSPVHLPFPMEIPPSGQGTLIHQHPAPNSAWEPGSRGGAEAGECTEPSITTSARGAGCTTELLTYGCANAVLTHVVIQEQLQKRHEVNTAAPAVLPSVILAAAAWEWDGQCRDLNDSKQQLGCGAESTPDPHIPLAG